MHKKRSNWFKSWYLYNIDMLWLHGIIYLSSMMDAPLYNFFLFILLREMENSVN